MNPDYKARKIGLPTMPMKDRIMQSVTVNSISGCWEWKGSKRNGYGRMTVGSRLDGTRKTMSAHRMSYIAFKGDIPDGYFVCHKCDNPCCVNPEHLFIGTRQDNIDDRENKHRNVIKVGEEHPRSKLTKKAVKDARHEHIVNGVSFMTLARKYNVSKSTIQNAINGITWKCVSYMPEPPEVRNDV